MLLTNGLKTAPLSLPADEMQLLESRKFADYWAAKAGAGGVKLDWQATWRNWVRNAKGQADGQQRYNDTTSFTEIAARVAARKVAAGMG